ncbi:MAG: trigger factor [Sphingobacteriales bacterium]|uniref:trigger factor n=1 Tax=Hydrotalea flava TaxID=714549 RepID=UPI000833E2E9|nr:trigger factor [Hydrotalea flava]RTL47791.1 MAG: trigger factor [Sphingobacteriales bacterium]
MANVTRENLSVLNDKITVTLSKEDYFEGFEKSLKKYAKTANIPGFRKGMIPAGLIKKMYGQSVFSEEVLRKVEKSLLDFLENEKLEIFAQPLPLENGSPALDMNNLVDYSFSFEIGLKPEVAIDVAKLKVTQYKVTVTDEMVEQEIDRLQVRNGKMTEPETVTGEDNVLNVKFVETDKEGNELEGGISKENSLLVKYFTEKFRKNLMGKKAGDSVDLQLKKAFDDKELDFILSDLGLEKGKKEDESKYFKLHITKVGLVERPELNEAFFETVYPGKGIVTIEEFKKAVRNEIENYYQAQALNQVHDQIYHQLLEHANFQFPDNFLKRWLQVSGERPKTTDEVEAEFPTFKEQLKWTLISNQLTLDNKIEVLPDDIRTLAKQQLLQYLGRQINMDENQQWVEDYANRMMQDRKFMEDSYHRIATEKMFTAVAEKVNKTEEAISAEDFAAKLHHHHH